MQYKLKKFIILLFQSILFWILAFICFALIRFLGLNEQLKVFTDEGLDISIDTFISIAVILGFIIGFFYAIIEYAFDVLINRMSLGTIILLKTILYLILIISAMTYLSYEIEDLIDRDLPNEEKLWWLVNKVFWVIILYFIIASLVFSFLKIANEKFGKGVFFKMLIGKYKQPQEEKRIFMFLDLKDSTTIAEQLGHIKYSKFIQDCFFDLNRIVSKYDAEIYQYVGDEAVLTWPYKNGIKRNNCIETYFAFVNRLNQREAYYLKNYKLMPQFKAGLHGGKLIIAEVGTIKKELAYHGDVINTSARIQSECNAYGETLLISEKLLSDLRPDAKYLSKLLGNILLKGKQATINILSINKA